MAKDVEYFLFRPRGSREYTRLNIAAAMRGRRRTLAECARALGKEYGSIDGVFSQMINEQVLEPLPGDAGPSTHYRLAAEEESVVDEAVAVAAAPGWLNDGQVLVEVRADDEVTLRRGLAHRELTTAVAWVMRLAGTEPAALLVISSRAETVAVDRLAAAPPEVGVRCRLLPIARVTPGAQFIQEGAAVLDAVEDVAARGRPR